jgi:Bacterial PH domain
MNTFKSKIDGLLLTPLIITNSFIMIFEIKKDKPSFILIIFIIVLYILFFAFIILTTKYIFIKEKLYIQYACLIKKTISILDITEIRYFSWEVRNSYSLSNDRIEIIYDNDKSIVISPKDKDGFIDELHLINPSIVVSY